MEQVGTGVCEPKKGGLVDRLFKLTSLNLKVLF
jgi:hypothetical protein